MIDGDCFAAGMRIWRHYMRGCLELLARDSLPVSLPWWAELRARCEALAMLPADRRARLILWLVLAASLLARSYCWSRDLSGWPRDILLVLPVLCAAPALLRLHRAALIRRLRRRR